MADCGIQIDTAGPIAFGCDLDQGHAGPHRAAENARSVRERAEWEARNAAPAPEPKLSDLQATPQTTAESKTLNPSPVPGTEEPPAPAAAPTPREDNPLFADGDLPTCIPCVNEAHRECYHREDIIAVRVQKTKPAVANFCDCFQQSPVDHGLDIRKKAAEPAPAGVDSTPTPEPSAQPVEPPAQEPEPTPEPEPDPDPIPEAEPEPEPPAEVSQLAETSSQPVNEEKSVQERLLEKMAVAVEENVMSEEEFAVMTTLVNSSLKKRGTTGELSTFNDKDTLALLVDRTRDALVYLSAMKDARDASRAAMVAAVVEAINEVKEAAKSSGEPLKAESLAEAAVDAIFRAAGGPVAT